MRNKSRNNKNSTTTEFIFDHSQYIDQKVELPVENEEQRRSKVVILSKCYKKRCYKILLLLALKKSFQSYSKFYLYEKEAEK